MDVLALAVTAARAMHPHRYGDHATLHVSWRYDRDAPPRMEWLVFINADVAIWPLDPNDNGDVISAGGWSW